MTSRWIHTAEQLPKKNGRYWVYPYRSLNGNIWVNIADFYDGKWTSEYREQEYTHWQAVLSPKPPKRECEKLIIDDSPNGLLRGLRRKTDRRY